MNVQDQPPAQSDSDAIAATIIVVTHNSAQWLERQRSALRQQSEQKWHLIVVDNASEPDQRPHSHDLPDRATLIQSETNMGFAAANNLAARQAQTPYLVFLNPDAFPEPYWLSILLTTIAAHPNAAAIGSTQIRADQPDVFDGAGDVMHASGLAYRAWYRRPLQTPPPLGSCFSACAAAMIVRRDAFEEIGGFDESYFCYFEDVDLCFRLRLRGWDVLQSPEAVVAHVGGGSTGVRTEFADFHGARNRLWTFMKCMPGPLMWALLPVHALMTSAAATMALLTGRGLAAWRGIGAGLRNLPWRTRSYVQARRTASFARVAGALAWSPLIFIGRQAVVRPLGRTRR